MSIPDKDFLPWVKLSTERLEKELQAQQEFVPAHKTCYPLLLNIKKKQKLKIDDERLKNFIPGKVFFPFNIDSALSKKQQAICLKVLQMYRSERNLNRLTKLEQENLEIYKKLQGVIQQEHVKFSEYVKTDWQKKLHRLENMRNHLFSYTKIVWEKKFHKVLSYPPLYKLHDTICLAYEDPDNHIQVSMQESVFNIGTPRTAIFPTMTSRCILNSLKLPSVEDRQINSQLSVSEDDNVLQALQTHNIDVVLSMSAIKRLMDDSNAHSSWNIPVLVKQCKIASPNGCDLFKKTVFIDKILPTQCPTKLEFNEQCHKWLIRCNFSRVFTESEGVDSDKKLISESSQNVVYNIWNITFNDKENVLLKTKKQNRKINFLLRQKLDGYENFMEEHKRPVVFVPKAEYQLEHGAAVSTKNELIRQWADLFFRPFSHLYRVRFQGNTSEVVDVESVTLQKINTDAMQLYQYKPYERLGALFTIFSKLTDLEVGSYMLHHDERTGAFAEVLKECSNTEKDIKLDLTETYNPKNCFVQVSKNKSWCPIDVNYILPAHSTYKRMPGMFKPLIIKYTKKKKGVKKRRKVEKKSLL